MTLPARRPALAPGELAAAHRRMAADLRRRALQALTAFDRHKLLTEAAHYTRLADAASVVVERIVGSDDE